MDRAVGVEEECLLISGGWPDSASDFHGPYCLVCSSGYPSLGAYSCPEFLAFLISLDFAFLMFARSAFFCDGTSMDTGSRPLRQSGYDYGNGKVLPFWRHGGKVLHSESLVFPGSAPRHIQYHLAFFFTGGFLMVYD